MPDNPSELYRSQDGSSCQQPAEWTCPQRAVWACPQRKVWTGRTLFLWAGLLLALLLAACIPAPTPLPALDTPTPGLPVNLSPTIPITTPDPSPTLSHTPVAAPTATLVETPTAAQPNAEHQVLSPENAAEMELIDQNREFPAQAAAWLPASDSLVLANQDALQLLILTDDQEEQVTQGPSLPTTLTVSPTSGRIAIARLDNQIDLFDPPRAGDSAAGDPAASLQGHTGTVTSLAFSADGRWLASAATDNTVRVWDVETGVLLGGWQLSYWVTDLAFSPEGARLAGVDLQAFTIHIWEIDSLPLDTPAPLDRTLGAPPVEQVLTWTQETIPALYQVEFSPDWSQVAWVARGTVQLMQVSTGELGPALQHEDFVNGVAWSPDGELLASAAAAMVDDQFNPATLIWDPQAGELINTLILPEPASGVYFSPDGKLLAILGAEGEVQLWAAPR